MSLYYLILWNQVDILKKTLQKGSCPYAPLDEALRYIALTFGSGDIHCIALKPVNIT